MTPLNPRGRPKPSLIVILVLLFQFATGLLQHRLLNWHLECLLLVEVCSSTNTDHDFIRLLTELPVYHWASITAGRYGRVCGFFAGFWNSLAWILGAASMSAILGQQTVSMYALMHPGFVPQAWHIFVSFIICTWLCCCIVLFMNRFLPHIGNLGMFFILAGVLITIIVCAVMPHVKGSGYATSKDVWSSWENDTGYSSQGFVFVAGMLNGAYSVGTPDCSSHLAEEIPK